MINAGLNIASFSGTQQFNSATSGWEGIKVTINYPTGQNSTINAPAVGDFVIEPDGKVWEVTGASSAGGNNFNLNLLLRSDTPNSSISPNLGLVQRGSIVTPVNGILTPYWDPVLVTSEIGQIAALYNTTIGTYGSGGTIESISGLQQALDGKLSIGGGSINGDLTVNGNLTEQQ